MKMRRLIVCLLFFIWVGVGVGQHGDAAAEEKPIVKWKLSSCWPKGLIHQFAYDTTFADMVKKLSDGKFVIEVYGAGELCACGELLDMVRTGTVEAGGDWPGYWAGKNTAFDLLGASQLGLCAEDYILWVYKAGGLELFNEVYGTQNCVYFPHSFPHMESGIRSNKPIRRMSDLKGMKIRMAGVMVGKMLQEFGATPTLIHLSELYEALRRGTIDGAELGVPTLDKDWHLEEVAKYWLTPGWHQTGGACGILINRDHWNKLSEHFKDIVRIAAMACAMDRTAEMAWNDALATEYFKEKGVIISKVPEEELIQLENVKIAVHEELAAANSLYAKVLKSQNNYLKTFAAYREFSRPYGFGRNSTRYPEIP